MGLWCVTEDRHARVEAHVAHARCVHGGAQDLRATLVHAKVRLVVDPEVVVRGREVEHGVAAPKCLAHGDGVAHVAADHAGRGMLTRARRRGFGEVEDRDAVATREERIAEQAADEPGAAGDEVVHRCGSGHVRS